MSDKNKLQEFCQKNKLDFPKYQPWKIGSSHEPEWYSKVTLTMDQEISAVTAVPSTTRTDADILAAKMMLEKISVPRNPKKSTEKISLVPSKISTIYLIDLENQPCFQQKLHEPNSLYLGFITSTHHSIDKYEDWHFAKSDRINEEINSNHKIIFTVQGGTPDLTDHLMTIFAYPILKFLIDTSIQPEIVIVSGDHAGWCARTCFEEVFQWNHLPDIKINNICKLTQLKSLQ